ncbi:MFS transporter [Pragia fontium]|uniref:MFS transporter n=1 Tax=Pragia fontium TaxID=82985 RepID=UPI000E03D833|nr:MFS transporter [Pragia fontium]SUB80985.1 D-galactarate permease [Pragia fontium]VEJ52821.1 D-galactarate permease [Pragia fontium]
MVRKKKSKVRFHIAILMLMATVVNYLDRTVMSAAAPVIEKDLQLSAEAMGWIMSAFFFSYALFQIPSGFLADRIGQRKTLAASVVWWSLATMATGLARTPFAFISARIFMGIGEAGAYPCNSGITAKWFPDRERGRVTALFDSGSKFGTAFAMPIVVWAIATWGWHAAFYICGGLGLLWTVWWLAVYREPEDHPTISEEELNYIRDGQAKKEGIDKSMPMKWYKLFGYRNVIAMCSGFFMLNYAIFFFITWFPSYLMNERGMSLAEMGFAAMLPPLAGIFGQYLGGWFTDFVYNKTNNLNMARKINLVGGMLLATSISFAGLVESTSVMLGLLCLSYAALAFAASALWCLPGDVAPRNMTSLLGGMQNAVANCGGILGPIVTGYIISSTGSFVPALVVSGGACLLGALIYLFVLKDIKPIVVEE